MAVVPFTSTWMSRTTIESYCMRLSGATVSFTRGLDVRSTAWFICFTRAVMRSRAAAALESVVALTVGGAGAAFFAGSPAMATALRPAAMLMITRAFFMGPSPG